MTYLRETDLQLLELLKEVQRTERELFAQLQNVKDAASTLTTLQKKGVITAALTAEDVTIAQDKFGNTHKIDSGEKVIQMIGKIYESIVANSEDVEYENYLYLLGMFSVDAVTEDADTDSEE